MPELPEVETVRRGLQRHVSGRVIDSVEVLHPRVVRRHQAGETGSLAALSGGRVGEIRRRGKFLWLPVAADALIAHLGMSGQFLIGDPGQPLTPHVRARFTFADGGTDLRFADQRTFGHLTFAPGGAALPSAIAHIAPDPFEAVFDDRRFSDRLRSRRTGVKRALLDQSLISGVGNIYADEALWRAKLHGERPASALRPTDVTRLLAGVREVFAAAIEAGGTSFDGLYVRVNGESGYFGRSLNVYGRAGQPCPRCLTPVRREKFMNRSSYSCPKCQPRPRRGPA
jgi:formamidopyrimidine-DNA glycosylase